MNNKVTRIIANSVGLAAVAALGITVYQLGTSPVKEKTPEEKTENVINNIDKNTWVSRAEEVINDLSGGC